MTDEELVESWIEHFKNDSKELSPAYVEMDDAVQDNPERAWKLILAILKRDQTDNIISCLAGGPLEDLLVYHGDCFIERIEQFAKENKDFNRLLGGVWKNDISDSIWNRLNSVRKEIW